MKTPEFRSELTLREADDNVDDGQWVVCVSLVFASLVAGMVITVPAGFRTDLASVPRLPLIYWLCGGRANKPATLHDYLYSTGLVPRAIADAIFLEAMAAVGVPRVYRLLMWAGVRVGGASHFAKQRAKRGRSAPGACRENERDASGKRHPGKRVAVGCYEQGAERNDAPAYAADDSEPAGASRRL
jgi:hypothetical protein